MVAARSDREPPIRVESVQPAGWFPVRLTLSEKLQLVGFLIVHTVVILAFAWKLSVALEHRITAIESKQDSVIENVKEIKADVRELRK